MRPEAKRLIVRWEKMSLNRGEKRDTQTLIQSPEHGCEEWVIVRLNLQAQSMKFLAWGHPP